MVMERSHIQLCARDTVRVPGSPGIKICLRIG
jgi:hypothetical protein